MHIGPARSRTSPRRGHLGRRPQRPGAWPARP
jgi:hypothetical protein